MKTFRGIETAQLNRPTWLTIGNFDGMHLGHQSLVRRTVDLAHANDANAAILTFDPHPIAVLRPGTELLHLTTTWERLRLAAEVGAEIGIIQPFSQEIASISARDFVLLLRKHLALAGLVVGPDFALGRKREGDISTLRTLGDELGFAVEVLEAVTWGERVVRSSAVREALQQGDIVTANTMLGRPYAITGVVTLGDQRGRTIGVPTANIQPDRAVVYPANGVYATRVTLALPGKIWTFDAATNVGIRPTIGGDLRRIEAHILDFPPPALPDDLYGHKLTVTFIARLRDEMRFDGLNALMAQIQQDIGETRAVLTTLRP